MCPLRVILLFLSAMLAGYFAFKAVQSDGDSSVLNLSEEEAEQVMEETSLLTKVRALNASLGRTFFTWNVESCRLLRRNETLT